MRVTLLVSEIIGRLDVVKDLGPHLPGIQPEVARTQGAAILAATLRVLRVERLGLFHLNGHPACALIDAAVDLYNCKPVGILYIQIEPAGLPDHDIIVRRP